MDDAEKNFEAIVIGNDGEHFGAGANLFLILVAAQQKAWDQIEKVVTRPAERAAAPALRARAGRGRALPVHAGRRREVAMAADACQAHAETYMGLVEVGVGLIPAGGGCLRMVERWTGGLPSGRSIRCR